MIDRAPISTYHTCCPASVEGADSTCDSRTPWRGPNPVDSTCSWLRAMHDERNVRDVSNFEKTRSRFFWFLIQTDSNRLTGVFSTEKDAHLRSAIIKLRKNGSQRFDAVNRRNPSRSRSARPQKISTPCVRRVVVVVADQINWKNWQQPRRMAAARNRIGRALVTILDCQALPETNFGG